MRVPTAIRNRRNRSLAARGIKLPVSRPSDDYKDGLWFDLISCNYDFKSVAAMSLKNLSESRRPLFDREY